MLNRIEFIQQLDRLQAVFSSLTEMAVEEYYNKFKFFDIKIIEEAINILISDYDGEFTPKPPIILGVINEIRRQSSEMLPGEKPPIPICRECDGTGFETWTGIDGRFKAKPCTKCEKGKRIADGWRQYFSKTYKKELVKKED